MSTAASPRRHASEFSSDLADRTTPLIRQCWYVAALNNDIGRELVSKRLLGLQVLLYRTEDGRVIALHDRCPHRSLPLSKGCLEGDTVRCGYHGLRFDSQGECVEAPPVGHIPKALRVAAFPVVEKGPLLWIWLGNTPPDETLIPDTQWLTSGDWAYASGQMFLSSNYVPLHENLLDLSHFTYLHPGNIGTPEYASAPYEVSVDGDLVRVERVVPDCAMPTIYRSSGIDPDARIARRTVSDFVSPSMHAAIGEFRDLSQVASKRVPFQIRITHFVTPADQNHTHYIFTFARNFAVDDPAVTAAMGAGAVKAFQEDADALEAIAQISADEPGFAEKSMRSDQAGIAMRRVITRLALAE